MVSKYVEEEKQFGQFLSRNKPEEIWRRTGRAGRQRIEERTQFLIKAAELTPDKKVLEIGCGTGIFSKELAQTNINITSIDISSELLELAHDTNECCDFVLNNAMETCFPEGTFDAVVGVAILHHLEMSKAIREVYRVLAPGGRFAFAEPNLLNPYIAMIVSFPWFSRITKMYQSATETACRPWAVGNRFSEHGFKDISVSPFDFLYPNTPAFLVPAAKQLSKLLCKTPLFKWLGGSLKISGRKPS